jgi:hypothetical protein
MPSRVMEHPQSHAASMKKKSIGCLIEELAKMQMKIRADIGGAVRKRLHQTACTFD